MVFQYWSDTFLLNLIRTYTYKYDIRTDCADTFEWNNKFIISDKKTTIIASIHPDAGSKSISITNPNMQQSVSLITVFPLSSHRRIGTPYYVLILLYCTD